jgi:uncharacterized radical SAM superfamily Fe-S cluster-containing enzyme
MNGGGDALLSSTSSLCGQCKRSLPAEIWRAAGAVVMRKRCPDHGPAEVLLSPDAAWYERTVAQAPRLTAPEPLRPVEHGCPFDCGPCASHQQAVELPILPITSACNLDCPICYTHNKNQDAWHMSERELGAVLAHLRRAAPGKRIINITGGEPTLHPALPRLIALCAAEGIRRITLSTHGLGFLKDEALLVALKRLDTRIVLSFDSFEATANREMLGGDLAAAKLRVLALLEKHDVDTTLLPVLARGQNDHEVGRFVTFALDKAFVRSVELHPMTFTGHGGARFDRGARYTTFEVLRDLEAQTAGALGVDDFVPSPAAHPLCYLVSYLLRLPDGRWLPFPRFMPPAELRAMLGRALYLEPGPDLEARLGDLIDRLWAGDIPCAEPGPVLAALRALTEAVFAPGLDEAGRLRAAERATKAVYVHAHMDEETFDTDRVRQCPVGIREPDGRNIPSCSYNVLYRERDPRFREHPDPPLVTLGRGRRFQIEGPPPQGVSAKQ